MNVHGELYSGTSRNASASRRRRGRYLDTGLTCAYFVGVVCMWLCLRFMTDVTWWGTVLAFAPRWPVAIPLAVLMPAALVLRRWRLLAVQGAAGVVIAWPNMGCTIAVGVTECPTASGLNIRVMTCNVQGRNVDSYTLSAWVDETSPEIVALQECPQTISAEVFTKGSWYIESEGNLCVASRFPIVRSERLDRRRFGGWGTIAQCCRINAPGGPIEFVNVHFMTVRPGVEAIMSKRLKGVPEMEANIAIRRQESKAVGLHIAENREPLLVAGDFNLPVVSAIYREYWSRYTNVFSEVGAGFGSTWHSRWHGIRIDHVLTDERWSPVCCRVGPDVGSDHRPVLAEVRRMQVINQ